MSCSPGAQDSCEEDNYDARTPKPVTALSPYARQIGGNHYKKKHDIFQFCVENEVGAGEYAVLKYVFRHAEKGKVEDLKKAKHCLEMLAFSKYDELI
jgi:hypothetical protein